MSCSLILMTYLLDFLPEVLSLFKPSSDATSQCSDSSYDLEECGSEYSNEEDYDSESIYNF
jgi:hypothetical protein